MRIGPGTAAERALRERAIAEAGELFAHHGEEAGEMLTDRIHDPELSAEERRRYRLARLEVERLGRERRKAHSPTALAVWRPPLFSWQGLGALFFRKGRRGTKRGRRR
jgi:hypothetical protein